MDIKTLGHNVTEILRGGHDGMKDAGEIACAMFLLLEAFVVSIQACEIRVNLFEIHFGDDVLFVELLELGDIAHRPPMIARDALNLHIARGPDNEITPVHPDRGHCPLDLMIVVMSLLEHVVPVEIRQIMVPLRGALDLHIAHRIGTFDFEDAHSTCSVRVSEDQSSGRGTHDVVSENPEPGWFYDTSGRVLIRINRYRFVILTPLDGWDVVDILGDIDFVAEMLV